MAKPFLQKNINRPPLQIMTLALLQTAEENLPFCAKTALTLNLPEPNATSSITIMTAPMLFVVLDMQTVTKYVRNIFSVMQKMSILENKGITGLAVKFRQEKITETR